MPRPDRASPGPSVPAGQPARAAATGVSFATRLTLALGLLLLLFGLLVALVGRQVAHRHEQEVLQRLSCGLARHIVEHWPVIASGGPDPADRAAREALLSMLMTVNPGIQVYLLDADGRVDAYLGESGMVRQHAVDLDPVRAFLAGQPLPLYGTDPASPGTPRIFSAAMFPPRASDLRPPGYLYIVLDGSARAVAADGVGWRRVWHGAALAGTIGLLLTLVAGAMAFRRLTLPLHRVARRMRAYSLGEAGHGSAALRPVEGPGSALGDEVLAISQAFGDMTRRIEDQAQRAHTLSAAHREVMAGVAHDLRTPLTALHGHLEALAAEACADPVRRRRVLDAALAQSDKVRRLSQQLFELAALEAADVILQRERICLEDLVCDTVAKFGVAMTPAPVELSGEPPGRLEVEADLQLVERALTNLIDNAIRHAASARPVFVSLRRTPQRAEVLIEDGGPGLPPELAARLEQGQAVKELHTRRPGGGIGGLGLAIAQRVAVLHGGSLRPLPCPGGGTRLVMSLPLAG